MRFTRTNHTADTERSTSSQTVTVSPPETLIERCVRLTALKNTLAESC